MGSIMLGQVRYVCGNCSNLSMLMRIAGLACEDDSK